MKKQPILALGTILGMLAASPASAQVTLTYKGRLETASHLPGALEQYSTWTAQLDSDVALEVITKSGNDLVVRDGNSLIEEARSAPAGETWSNEQMGTVLVYDFDGDGLLEIVAQKATGALIGDQYWYVWDTGATDSSSLPPSREALQAVGLTRTVPEPASPACRVHFTLAGNQDVTIRILDVTGRLVRTVVDHLALPAGDHRLDWDGIDRDGRGVPGGVYFVQVATKDGVDSRRITLVR